MDLRILILANCFGNVTPEKAGEYSVIITEAARRYHVDPTLIVATMMGESRCIENTVNSRTGASGLMQLLPETATGLLLGTRIVKKVLLNPSTIQDPIVNITLGTRYLTKMIKKCGGSVEGALSLYNGRSNCQPSCYSEEILTIQKKLQR